MLIPFNNWKETFNFGTSISWNFILTILDSFSQSFLIKKDNLISNKKILLPCIYLTEVQLQLENIKLLVKSYC